ncbi:MAG: HAMP domain-containing sensor histidine kinase [Calditrichota bacterium]|jgi:signal transduction histidine kinase
MLKENTAAILSESENFISEYSEKLRAAKFATQTLNPSDGWSKKISAELYDCCVIDNTHGSFPYSKFLPYLKNNKIQMFIINIGENIPEQIDNPYLTFNFKSKLDDLVFSAFLKNALSVLNRDRAQAELASMLVHDIRSPLNSLIGYLELLINGTFGPISEGHKNILEKAMDMGDSTLDLLEDLNEVFHKEQDSFVIQKQPFSLLKLIDAVLSNVWVKADKKNIQIKKEIPSNLGELLGDDYQIQRLLTNIISNAIKYSPKNSRIIIGAHAIDNGFAEIRVSDNGQGVPENHLPYLFEKYYRIKEKDKIQKGYGLGLYICKIIVTAHGGKIWAENNQQGGLTVSFTLQTVTD